MNWQQSKLGNVVTISKGKKHSITEEGTRYLQIEDLRENPSIKFTSDNKGTLVDTNDIIIAWDGAHSGLVSYGLKGFIGSTLARLKVSNKDIYTPFLGRYLQSKFLTIQANRTGATIPHVNKDALCSLYIPLPPIEEQKRIAAILHKADAIRRKRKEAIALTEELLRSTFLDMFDDPVTNPKGLKKASLEQIADIITGYPFKSSSYVDSSEGVRLCRGANVLPDTLNWKDVCYWDKRDIQQFEKFRLEKGDIVVALDRPWISSGFKIALVSPQDVPAFLVQRVARIRTRQKIFQNYLYFSLRHHAFERHCHPTETTVPHISPTDLKTFPVLIPEMEKIDSFNSLVERQKKKLDRSHSQFNYLENLFNSLLQKAFRGEL